MHIFNTQDDTRIQEDIDILEAIVHPYRLVVHNDEVNTFDWVIESLVEICNHTPEQAEQCSLIIHFKGKASVREGTKEKMRPMKEALCERGINATLEEEMD